MSAAEHQLDGADVDVIRDQTTHAHRPHAGLRWYRSLSILNRRIFDSSVEGGTPSRAAAP
jgi:hypothetical protein